MSLAFNILDETRTTHTHTLDALCGHLSATVVAPFLRSQGVYWDPRFEQYFLHHAESDPFAATGTIDFYPPPMFLGQLGQLEDAIRGALEALCIKTGPFVPRHYPDGLAIKVIEIPILTNPTVLSGPPEVSMATNGGRLVLSNVLGYQPANGRYEFTADDLLERVAGVTEDRIESQSKAPVCDRNEPQPRQVKPTTSAVTIHRIRRCLSELRALGEWAKANDYQRIEAVPTKKN